VLKREFILGRDAYILVPNRGLVGSSGAMRRNRVFLLVLTGLREAAERAVVWMSGKSFGSISLDLPEDLTPYVREYISGRMSQQNLWKNYAYLTGLQQPFVNALRYGAGPILNALPWLKCRMPELEAYCYQDLKSHMESCRLSEKILLMETVGRVRGRVDAEEWRRILSQEFECATVGLARALENIVEVAEDVSENVVLCSGFTRLFKERLEEDGFQVKPIHLQHYWRPPLDVLGAIAWLRGVENVSSDLIVGCVKSHLRYLDYVISSEDIDVAHARWELEIWQNAT